MPPEASAAPVDSLNVSTTARPAPASKNAPADSTSPPDAAAWAHMSPDARAAHNRSLPRDAGDFADPARYEQRRAADGSTVTIDRSTGKPVDGAGDQPSGDTSAQPNVDPAGLSTDKTAVGRYSVSESELAAMMERQAVEDQRRATLPATPEAYLPELPKDIQLPGGAQFTIDPNDAAIADARAFAHRVGLSQDQFSGMLAIYASHMAQQQAVINEARNRELAAAGPNASQRVTAIEKFLRAELGDADARPVLATLATAAHLRAFEKWMQHKVSGGVASFSQKHRDPEPNRLSDEEWSRMSYGEKKQYAERSGARR